MSRCRHPGQGPTTAASQQVWDLYILPDMFAQYATVRHELGPQAIAWGEKEIRVSKILTASGRPDAVGRARSSIIQERGKNCCRKRSCGQALALYGLRLAWAVAAPIDPTVALRTSPTHIHNVFSSTSPRTTPKSVRAKRQFSSPSARAAERNVP